MVSIAVCDDSKQIVESMEMLLNRYSLESEAEIRVFKFNTGKDLLKNYNGSYDLIFLDIKMPGMSGIEVAEEIRKKDDKVTIVFLTSLLNRAVDGYKVRAANYIIKPMSYKRLKIELESWFVKERQKDAPYIIINNDNGSYRVILQSISHIETFNRNLLVHTDNGNIASYQKMKHMAEALLQYGFVRCHSSYIVNLFYVEKVEKMDIQLVTSQKIPISQTKRKFFMESLAEYWGKRL